MQKLTGQDMQNEKYQSKRLLDKTCKMRNICPKSYSTKRASWETSVQIAVENMHSWRHQCQRLLLYNTYRIRYFTQNVTVKPRKLGEILICAKGGRKKSNHLLTCLSKNHSTKHATWEISVQRITLQNTQNGRYQYKGLLYKAHRTGYISGKDYSTRVTIQSTQDGRYKCKGLLYKGYSTKHTGREI